MDRKKWTFDGQIMDMVPVHYFCPFAVVHFLCPFFQANKSLKLKTIA